MDANNKLIPFLPQFIKDLNRIQPEYSSSDKVWRLPIRIGTGSKSWGMVFVTQYQDTYYFSWTKNPRLSLQIDAKGKLIAEEGNPNFSETDKLIWALKQFHVRVKKIGKDWVGVHRETIRDYPLSLRYGIVSKSIVWKYYPNIYRVDADLGKAHVGKFIELTRTYKFSKPYPCHHKEMTLALYMRYCKIAYLANADKFTCAIKQGISGLKLYKIYADGRDMGLTEIQADSADAFKAWYHSKGGGGHPWEIYRGGNTTHVSLGIEAETNGWSVWLAGSSSSRLAETIRIALALHEAGLPVEVCGAEKIVLRLLGTDNMGIIPEYIMNHRANQDFAEEDHVFDCAHLSDLPRYNRILPFVTWKPIASARPLVV